MVNKLAPKDRVKIPRQRMVEQDARERAANFREVNLGLSPAIATKEAQRCLTCTDPKCVQGCPVGVEIRKFIELFLEGDYNAAAACIRRDNVLPMVTGRVCPQESQCEGSCVLGKRHSPVAIGYLERFIADHERSLGGPASGTKRAPTGKRVAIVGSGPAGLSCAGDLAGEGHGVTVFEALHELGGVLVYGIPEFRLPKDVVRQEVDYLARMGVEFQTNVVIGKTVTLEELLGEGGFDAVFIAAGAGLPKFLNIPGENLCGVFSANEFLTRINLMKAFDPEYDEPIYDCRDRHVAVIGAGNTAMDAVRSALRLGARRASIIYRRSEAEMPARAEEVKHARAEGVTFITLHSPVEFIGDDKGILQGCRLQKMELVEPDGSGRPRPVAIPGSEHIIPLDVAIIAACRQRARSFHCTLPRKLSRYRFGGRAGANHRRRKVSVKC